MEAYPGTVQPPHGGSNKDAKSLKPWLHKAADKELAKLQIFVLDSLAPLTTLLVYSNGMLVEKVKKASSTTVELLRSANARISCLRREKLVTSINMNLAPLV